MKSSMGWCLVVILGNLLQQLDAICSVRDKNVRPLNSFRSLGWCLDRLVVWGVLTANVTLRAHLLVVRCSLTSHAIISSAASLSILGRSTTQRRGSASRQPGGVDAPGPGVKTWREGDRAHRGGPEHGGIKSKKLQSNEMKVFFRIVPSIIANMVDCRLLKDKLLRRGHEVKSAVHTYDGFLLGVAFVVKVLEQENPFDGAQLVCLHKNKIRGRDGGQGQQENR